MSGSDLDRAVLAPLLGERALRVFPAMLSTDSEALAWARQGAPDRAVVVTAYQASPRGRSGLSWDDHVTVDAGFGCSIVVRPEELPVEREGWPYLPVLLGLRDGLEDDELVVEWPDRVHRGDEVVAAIGVQTEPHGGRIRWAVATILDFTAGPPRAERLAAVLAAVDARLAQPAEVVLDAYREHCATLGRCIRASILPMGPASPSFTGEAVNVTDDGGLVIATDEGERIVVVPQSLGRVEDPDAGPMGPPGIG